jgi:hypothetical protein
MMTVGHALRKSLSQAKGSTLLSFVVAMREQ